MRLLCQLATATLIALAAGPAMASDADAPTTKALDVASLPWQTNMDGPPIGDPKAIKGGTYVDSIPGYPLTFRLYGPNANEYFANYSRPYSSDIALVWRHPTTDRHIPILATHWAIGEDHRTVYYRLDPDARWSDGQPITADDYVFTLEFLKSPHIADPAVNTLAEEYFEAVEKIDTHTIKIVGKRPSWRPLDDYNMSPVPRHATRLGPDWPQRVNYVPPVVQGPYTITEFTAGQRLAFTRNPNWWGYKKHYFQGMFNVDRFELFVLADQDQGLDYFVRGQLTALPVYSARMWAERMNLDGLAKGWMRRKSVFLESPQGLYGIGFNVQKPIFRNKDFRKALQYAFNFDELNRNLMFSTYYRTGSYFEGTRYANLDMPSYGFDPRAARRHLQAAGFTQRGQDGIWRRPDGTRASFTLTYGSASIERHLTVIQNQFKALGVEMKLERLEPVASFERVREKAHEAAIISMTAGFYPEPHQYFSSEFANKPQTNNFFGFGTPETDRLIDVYRFDMDEEKRIAALRELDARLTDEALLIHFWTAPFTRLVHWSYLEFPEFYLPKRAQSLMEYQVFWINPTVKARVDAAMATGESLPVDNVIELDPYGVKARMDERARRAAAASAAQN
jgi:microcin C transport system substrate-binding protein